MTDRRHNEEISMQVQSAVAPLTRVIYDIQTYQKEQAEKQADIHIETAETLGAIKTELGTLKKLEDTTNNILKEAMKTNGRVTKLEDAKLDERIKTIEKEASRFMGAVRMLVFVGAGYVAILTGLAYYYAKDVEHRVASDVVRTLQEKYEVKIIK